MTTSAAVATESTELGRRVLAGLGADRADVRACLGEQVAASPDRAAEVQRLDDVLAWLSTPMSRASAEAFREILARFNHERRIDTAELATLTAGRLVPRHVSTYARVARALDAGHDPRIVFCGLKEAS